MENIQALHCHQTSSKKYPSYRDFLTFDLHSLSENAHQFSGLILLLQACFLLIFSMLSTKLLQRIVSLVSCVVCIPTHPHTYTHYGGCLYLIVCFFSFWRKWLLPTPSYEYCLLYLSSCSYQPTPFQDSLRIRNFVLRILSRLGTVVNILEWARISEVLGDF